MTEIKDISRVLKTLQRTVTDEMKAVKKVLAELVNLEPKSTMGFAEPRIPTDFVNSFVFRSEQKARTGYKASYSIH